MSDPASANIGFPEALDVIERIARGYRSKGGRSLPEYVVMVGGTALAALGVRQFSQDVDLFMRSVDASVVDDVEASLKGIYGNRFKIDATSGRNLWGSFVLDDIEASPSVARIDLDGTSVDVRALAPETLYAIKVAAGRPKDLRDLPLLARHLDFGRLMDRVNLMIDWFDDRGDLPDFLDRFARSAARDFSVPLARVDAAIECSTQTKSKMFETRKAQEQQFIGLARRIVLASPHMIAPDENDPSRMTFDFSGAGVPPEARSALLANPSVLVDIVMEALGGSDPRRMLAWRMAARGKEPRVVDRTDPHPRPEDDVLPTP